MFEKEFPQLSELMKDIYEEFGSSHRIVNTIEELSELQKVLCKFLRSGSNPFAFNNLKERVIEEIADVYLTIEETKNILHIKDNEILLVMEKKINRGVRK